VVDATDLSRLQGWDLANIDFRSVAVGYSKGREGCRHDSLFGALRGEARLVPMQRVDLPRWTRVGLDKQIYQRRSLLVVRPAVREKSRGGEEGAMALFRRTNSAAIALNPVGSDSYRRVWPTSVASRSRMRSVCLYDLFAYIWAPVPDFAALQLPNRCRRGLRMSAGCLPLLRRAMI
jgi:hypothetical protein